MSVLRFSAARERRSILEAMSRLDLVEQKNNPTIEPLTGGVSSEVWLIKNVGKTPVIAKRALRKLKVAAEWIIDVRRTEYEERWLGMTAEDLPLHVPKCLGYDDVSGFLFLEYLSPPTYSQWGEKLLAGEIDASFAANVGSALANIHRVSYRSNERIKRFHDEDLFTQTRIDPYFTFLESTHSDISDYICDIKQTVLNNKTTVIHGDVSPKNILCGPSGPIFLDAECATASDPAFDLPFCLAQLLLISLVHGDYSQKIASASVSCARAYLAGAEWEPRGPLESRMSRLLAIFMLSRIDGKVPVPFINLERQRALVRRFVKSELWSRPHTLETTIKRWERYCDQWWQKDNNRCADQHGNRGDGKWTTLQQTKR